MVNGLRAVAIRGIPMQEFFVRFLIGGLVVSFFAVLGDVLKPKPAESK